MQILIIEDHPIVRQALADLLVRHVDGCAVHQACGVADATTLPVPKGGFDVAVLDLILPGESTGIATVRLFRAAFSQVRLLAMSGMDSFDFVPALLSAGADGYLPKSAQPDSIVQGVRSVAHGESCLPPEFGGQSPKSGQLEPHRQVQILELLAQGLADKEIARLLGISDETVAYHVRGIFKALNVVSRAQAVARGFQIGYLKLSPEPPRRH